MKKIVWILFSLLLLTLSHSTWAATVVKAEFVAGWPEYDGGEFQFSGNFVGEDLNNDGLLSFGEFSVFNWRSTYESFTIADLFDTGDIMISTQEWLNNGISWIGASDLAYIIWDDRGQSINTILKGEYRFTSFEVSAVPLPPAALLFAPALLGFMGLRRKVKLAV